MSREELEQLLMRRPFHPFKVTLTTGETYEVVVPGRVAVAPNHFAIGLEEEGIFKRFGFNTVARLEEMAAT